MASETRGHSWGEKIPSKWLLCYGLVGICSKPSSWQLLVSHSSPKKNFFASRRVIFFFQTTHLSQDQLGILFTWWKKWLQNSSFWRRPCRFFFQKVCRKKSWKMHRFPSVSSSKSLWFQLPLMKIKWFGIRRRLVTQKTIKIVQNPKRDPSTNWLSFSVAAQCKISEVQGSKFGNIPTIQKPRVIILNQSQQCLLKTNFPQNYHTFGSSLNTADCLEGGPLRSLQVELWGPYKWPYK